MVLSFLGDWSDRKWREVIDISENGFHIDYRSLEIG